MALENTTNPLTGCWFQPIWKILVKLEIFPNRGENKQYWKPPPSWGFVGFQHQNLPESHLQGHHYSATTSYHDSALAAKQLRKTMTVILVGLRNLWKKTI